ncbi:MAG: hypothetical protein WB402_11135 [Sulfuricaulis sp.]|uniref:hypothetical protein n=1 Tax=Sulfuricaulis sp. TaxID=2003553 RepID=UPI003C5D87D5
MKKIMLVHPVGSLEINPNLIGIVEALCARGYGVDYYCARSREFRQNYQHPSFRYIYLEGNQVHLADRCDLVIGVDRVGVAMAAKVSAALRVPYGLISYELAFSSEVGSLGKRPEIEACRGISFAVCQDRVRSQHLANENHIPLERIIDIPVAAAGTRPRVRSKALHKALGLSSDKKIMLYTGSLAQPWTMVDELVENTRSWGGNWVLVLHYSSMAQKFLELKARHPGADRMLASPWTDLPFDGLMDIMGSADLGVALYRPVFTDPEDGLNMEYLGLSSGKTITYLRHALPVVVNDHGIMGDYVENRGLGFRIRVLEDLPAALGKLDDQTLEKWSVECHRFYSEVLDLDMRISPLLDTIEGLIGK